mgnify:CR=1 FL=1
MKFREKISLMFKKSEITRLLLLLFGMIIMAILEVAGITTILPFIAVLASPELIHENIYLSEVYRFFNFQTDQSMIVFLGLFVLISLLISNSYQVFMTWAITIFSNLQNARISIRLLNHYMSQPYSFFLGRNTSELQKNILVETSAAITGVIMGSLQVVSKIITALFLISLLIYVDYKIAVTVAIILGGSYLIIFMLIRKKLAFIGSETVKENFYLYKTSGEALSGFKDIKLSGSYKNFVEQFSLPSKALANYHTQSNLVATLPRYLLEIIAFGGIISIIISLISRSGLTDTQSILPILSLYVMAGYRLLPALQQIYSGISRIKFHAPSFEIIVNEFLIFDNQEIESTKYNGTLKFEERLEMVDWSFYYENSSTAALTKINLIIHPNTTIGIVGSTGSGKTTIVDALLGLLHTKSGKILVDGIEINAQNVSLWQQKIGYVPQSIYLIDDTIEANISFAKMSKEVDIEKVIKAAKLANLHEFVMSLPEQYKTIIGERGVRLSGGQCQRIGIARALYDDPKVLVFDEATSSLDGITENAIMDAIQILSHNKTIIMIAHRLTTVKECDLIHFMSEGKIVESGTYQQLITNNQEFQKLALVNTNENNKKLEI